MVISSPVKVLDFQTVLVDVVVFVVCLLELPRDFFKLALLPEHDHVFSLSDTLPHLNFLVLHNFHLCSAS